MKRFLMIISCLLVIVGCESQVNSGMNPKVDKVETELLILGAASLTDALKEIKKTFESQHPSIHLTMSYASSGKLQKQIEQGATADLFLSAGVRQVDAIEKKDLIQPEYRTDFLKNEIVLITQKKNSKVNSFKDLNKQNIHKLSIGHPQLVPAGHYAKQVLESLNLWKTVEPKVVFANNVRQVLTYVETGNVEAGIVYKTDLITSDQVQTIKTAPKGSHEPIVYPMAITKGTEHMKDIKLFYHWLQSEKALEIFNDYGFSPAE